MLPVSFQPSLTFHCHLVVLTAVLCCTVLFCAIVMFVFPVYRLNRDCVPVPQKLLSGLAENTLVLNDLHIDHHEVDPLCRFLTSKTVSYKNNLVDVIVCRLLQECTGLLPSFMPFSFFLP